MRFAAEVGLNRQMRRVFLAVMRGLDQEYFDFQSKEMKRNTELSRPQSKGKNGRKWQDGHLGQ